MCDEFDSGDLESFDSGESSFDEVSVGELSDVMDSEPIGFDDSSVMEEIPDDSFEDMGEEGIDSVMDDVAEEYPDDIIEDDNSDDLIEESDFSDNAIDDDLLEEGVEDIPEETYETNDYEGVEEAAEEQPEVIEEAVGDATIEEAENSAMDNMAEYFAEHNYGREDYETYSKDPEWQQLNNDLLTEMGREPIDYDSVVETEGTSAYDNMTEYMYEHNYGREDYETYSKDPEWQQLNNDLLTELGREPIDYGDSTTESVENNIPEETIAENPSVEDIMDSVDISNHDLIDEGLEDSMDVTADGSVESSVSDWMDEVVISENDETLVDSALEAEIDTSEIQYQIEHNVEFQNSLLESRPDLAEMFENGEFYEQGNNEFGFEGTCGETTQANTLNHLLGTNEFTENDVLSIAIDKNLCEVDMDIPANSGGTSTEQFMELYEEMNHRIGDQLDVNVFDYDNALDIEEMASKLDDGSVLNIAVDSNVLWDQPPDLMDGMHYTDHWISVTGVERDIYGSISGFKIVDSGGGESYLDVEKFERCYYGEKESPVIDPTCIVVSKKGK